MFMSSLSSSTKDSLPQTVKTIESYLKQKDIQYQHGHTTIIAKCPFCVTTNSATSRKQGGKESYSLFVNKTTGSNVCNTCGVSGTWSQLKVFLTLLLCHVQDVYDTLRMVQIGNFINL